MKLARFWLAVLLTASVTTWGAGCGGDDDLDVDEDVGAPPATAEDDTDVAETGETDDADDAAREPKPAPPTAGGTETASTDTTPGGTTTEPDPSPTTTGDTKPKPPAGGKVAPSAEEAARQWFAAAEAGRAGELWDQMPASYQKDVNDVVHMAAAKADPELWNKTFAVLGKATSVLKKQKQYVLGNQSVAFFTMQMKPEELEAVYDGVLGILNTVFESDVSKIEEVRTMDVGEYLSSIVPQIHEQAEAIRSKLPEDQAAEIGIKVPTKIEVVEAGEESATLAFTNDVKVEELDPDTGDVKVSYKEQTEEVTFVKVEGQWVPKEMADAWQQQVTQVKQAIADLPDEVVAEQKQNVMTALNEVDQSLDALAEADSQAAFDMAVFQQMQRLEQELAPLLPTGPGGPNGGPGFPEKTDPLKENPQDKPEN